MEELFKLFKYFTDWQSRREPDTKWVSSNAYILRVTDGKVSGFGGLKSVNLEIWRKEGTKSEVIKSGEVKGKTDEVWKLAEQKLFDLIIELCLYREI